METKTEAGVKDSSPVTGEKKVTREDLEAALRGVDVNVAEEEEKPVEEELKEKAEGKDEGAKADEAAKPAAAEDEEDAELDHRERSRLGRRVKGLEAKLEEALALLRQQTTAAGKSTASAAEEEEEPPAVIATIEDLERANRFLEKKKMQERSAYAVQYSDEFLKLGKDEPDYAEIEKEMMEHHNVVRTGDPRIDAQMNFDKARISLYRKKLGEKSQPKPNVRGEDTKGTGVTVTAANVSAKGKSVELPDDVRDFIRRIKRDESWAAEEFARK